MLRLSLTHEQYELKYKQIIGRILGKGAKHEELVKQIIALTDPYTADLYYNHERIIQDLITRYKQVYGSPTTKTTS